MVCTNSSQTNPGMEIWAQNLTQNKELVCNWYLLIKELSSVFCNKVTLGISITLQSRSPAQVEQQKIRAVSCLCVCFLWFGDFLFFSFYMWGRVVDRVLLREKVNMRLHRYWGEEDLGGFGEGKYEKHSEWKDSIRQGDMNLSSMLSFGLAIARAWAWSPEWKEKQRV